MEETVTLNCFKVASSMPLSIIAEEYAINRSSSWKDYLILDDSQIEKFLKSKTYEKRVYIFSYGCITFVNFDEEEILVFLEEIGMVVGKIDYNLFGKYYEKHILEFNKNGMIKLTRGSEDFISLDNNIIDMISIILAKSVALYKIENDASKLVDEAESFINYLKRGKMPIKAKDFSRISSKMMRFEYDMANGIRILDKPEQNDIGQHMEWNKIYSILEEYYEIGERVDVIGSKIENLRIITKNCFTISNSKNFVMQYKFECLLLALFPLKYILISLIGKHFFNDIYQFLFK